MTTNAVERFLQRRIGKRSCFWDGQNTSRLRGCYITFGAKGETKAKIVISSWLRKVPMASEMEHVYCYQLGSDNCHKVGRTKNLPDERMRGFATGSPMKFELYRDIETENSRGLEKYIHKLLDAKRAENGEFFKVDAQELNDAVDKAVTFMEELQPLRREANKLGQNNKPSDTMVSPSEEMLQTYRQLRELRRDKYLIEQRIELLSSKIQVAIGDNCGMKGVASWKWIDHWAMDFERFKSEQPALYEEYKHNLGGRRFRLESVDLTGGD